MLKKVALLVAALMFAVPVFAQSTPGAEAPAAAQDAKPAKKHHKAHKNKKAKKADKEAAPQ